MTYSEFLFSQLFVAFCENNPTKYSDKLEYDLIYPVILSKYQQFLQSEYNTDTKGEYQCILNYLKETKL